MDNQYSECALCEGPDTAYTLLSLDRVMLTVFYFCIFRHARVTNPFSSSSPIPSVLFCPPSPLLDANVTLTLLFSSAASHATGAEQDRAGWERADSVIFVAISCC